MIFLILAHLFAICLNKFKCLASKSHTALGSALESSAENWPNYVSNKVLVKYFPLLHTLLGCKVLNYKKNESICVEKKDFHSSFHDNWFVEWCSLRGDDKTVCDNIIIIMPGIYGSAKDLLYLLPSLLLKNVRVVVLPNFTYDGSDCRHLKMLVSYCKKVNENCKLHAIGISLGGNKLAQYLTSVGRDSKIESALLISVVLNAQETTDNLQKFKYKHTIDKYMTRKFNSLHRTNFECILDIVKNFIVPNHNHKSLQNYYAKASIHDKLNKIKVPAVFFIARDDMFVPNLYEDKFAQNAQFLQLIAPRHGGHAAFLYDDCENSFQNEIVAKYLNDHVFKKKV